MRFAQLSVLWLFFAVAGLAQQSNPRWQINWPVLTGSGAPALTCQTTNPPPSGAVVAGTPYLDVANNVEYRCGAGGTWIQMAAKSLFGSGAPAAACSSVANNGSAYTDVTNALLYFCNGTTTTWEGPFGATGPPGPAGPTGNWRGAWTASTAYAKNDVFTDAGQAYAVVTAYTSGATFGATDLANTTAIATPAAAGSAGAVQTADGAGGFFGVNPAGGYYVNSSIKNSVPSIWTVPTQPIQSAQLPLSGNNHYEMAGNSIPFGTGSTSCSTGSNAPTGTCFVDEIALDMGFSASGQKNNIAVGGAMAPDFIGQILDDSFGLPSNVDETPRHIMNLLNDADAGTRGAYEADSKSALKAAALIWLSDPSTRIRGQDVTPGTNWSLDTTYSDWSMLQTSTTGAVQTFTVVIPSNGGVSAAGAIYVLVPEIDLGVNGACGSICPGSVNIAVNGGYAYTVSNASPVPVNTLNGATRTVFAYKIPLTSISPGTYTVTATSVITGSQNYAGVAGVIWVPIGTYLSSYSISASVPTFTMRNTVCPAVGQKLLLQDFATGTYFNGQSVRVTSANCGSSTFTTTSVAGMPSSLSSKSETYALASPAEPALWLVGNSRNSRASAENDRDVQTYDNLTRDLVRELQGDGWGAQLNYQQVQTSWTNNAQSMQPSLGAHHPDAVFGQAQIKAALEGPAFQPEIIPPSRKATMRTVREITSTTPGGCTLSTTDDFVLVFNGSAMTCVLPDLLSTAAATSGSNQGLKITLINRGAGAVTVNQNGGEAWTDNGIVLSGGNVLVIAAGVQGGSGDSPGRWNTVSKNVAATLPCAYSYTPGTAYTIPATTTCQTIIGNTSTVATQVTYTFASVTGMTPGSYWQITNSLSSTNDAVFTNGVGMKIHPGYTGIVIATSATTLQALGEYPYANTSMMVNSRGSAFTLSTLDEWDFCSSNSAAWVMTLQTLNSPFHNYFHNVCLWPITFTGATAGNANSATALPGEFFMIVSETSGRWDVLPVGSVKSGASSSIGGSALAAGACTNGTIGMQGVAAGMRFDAPAPSVDIGSGFSVRARVAATGTITIDVCNVNSTSATPTAATYTVDVTP